jgi:hypothetical protein
MRNILFSVLLAFSLISLTTGCSMMGGEGGSKCGSGHDGKCGADKKRGAKKCGAEKNGKCGSAK